MTFILFIDGSKKSLDFLLCLYLMRVFYATVVPLYWKIVTIWENEWILNYFCWKPVLIFAYSFRYIRLSWCFFTIVTPIRSIFCAQDFWSPLKLNVKLCLFGFIFHWFRQDKTPLKCQKPDWIVQTISF